MMWAVLLYVLTACPNELPQEDKEACHKIYADCVKLTTERNFAADPARFCVTYTIRAMEEQGR